MQNVMNYSDARVSDNERSKDTALVNTITIVIVRGVDKVLFIYIQNCNLLDMNDLIHSKRVAHQCHIQQQY